MKADEKDFNESNLEFDQGDIKISLSFFDLMRGPREIIELPEGNEDEKLFISEFFDFHQSGDFFTHIFEEKISFNKLFDVKREGARGGHRSYMLTALVSLDLLRRRDLLQYYSSFENLFDNWATSFSNIDALNDIIQDGYKEDYYKENRKELRPITNILNDFVEEMKYIIDTMPEVVSVPINRVN